MIHGEDHFIVNLRDCSRGVQHHAVVPTPLNVSVRREAASRRILYELVQTVLRE